MRLKNSSFKSTFLFWLLALSCSSSISQKRILPGAYLQDQYIPLLIKKKVGVVAHQASLIPKRNTSQHLVDFLLENNIDIHSIFAPEHGYRGISDAGEYVNDGTDVKTGLPIISLYGKNRKPNANSLKDLDLIIFDIQGVGARFYN